jgi:CDP-2,3-bis-(O-geranylgeranyl)-sn-glycerol synthase
MTPPLIKKAGVFKFLDRPVDFEKKFHGEPFFGNHKTWRGVIFGILAGFLAVLIQGYLYQFPAVQNISFLNYYQINIFLFGFLISGGAIFGDLFFAFIKRRINLKPGQRFLPFDQTNYVIGSFIFLQPVLKLDYSVWITLFILTFFLHIIFNRIGYLLNLHKNKW